MKKYAKVINEQTGLCEVGTGTNTSFYRSIGMTQKDVEQSDIDGSWYLKAKCPMKTDAQKLQEAKDAKYKEANEGARAYLESDNALFELTETRHIEATDGNIGKLGAYALGYVTGAYGAEDVIYWNTKEDETITLNQVELSQVLQGLGAVQAEVWNVKFPAYLAQIEACETADEVENIVIDYSTAAEDSSEVEEGIDENTAVEATPDTGIQEIQEESSGEVE